MNTPTAEGSADGPQTASGSFLVPELATGTGLMVLGIAPLTLFGVISYASLAGVTVARSSVPRSRDGQTRAEERHFQDLVGHR